MFLITNNYLKTTITTLAIRSPLNTYMRIPRTSKNVAHYTRARYYYTGARSRRQPILIPDLPIRAACIYFARSHNCAHASPSLASSFPNLKSNLEESERESNTYAYSATVNVSRG